MRAHRLGTDFDDERCNQRGAGRRRRRRMKHTVERVHEVERARQVALMTRFGVVDMAIPGEDDTQIAAVGAGSKACQESMDHQQACNAGCSSAPANSELLHQDRSIVVQVGTAGQHRTRATKYRFEPAGAGANPAKQGLVCRGAPLPGLCCAVQTPNTPVFSGVPGICTIRPLVRAGRAGWVGGRDAQPTTTGTATYSIRLYTNPTMEKRAKKRRTRLSAPSNEAQAAKARANALTSKTS